MRVFAPPWVRTILLALILGSCLESRLGAVEQDPALEAERLVFLLQYIGADYGAAVAEGRIADTREYQEVATFSKVLVDSFGVLRRRGAPEDVGRELVHLQTLIRDRTLGVARGVPCG